MHSNTSLIDARIQHEDAQIAHRLQIQQERCIRHRSRREWHRIWFAELEAFRSLPHLQLVSDLLGIVWYKDRAQLLLYSEPPTHPVKEFAMEDIMHDRRLFSQKQGLVGWAVRDGVTLHWVSARATEPDVAWYRYFSHRWPGDVGRGPLPTPVDSSQWVEDIETILTSRWTCPRNPARGFWGLSQKYWLVGGMMGIVGFAIILWILNGLPR